jgi:glycosyltransferase involved in cell wall biosynthesis
MKIAQIVCTFPPYPGGIGNVAYYNSLELARLGHEVVVFTPNERDLETAGENIFQIKYLRPVFRYGNAAFVPQLFWQLSSFAKATEDKGFDIIHLHYPFFGGAKVVWLRKLMNRKVKLIITYHMDVVGKGWLSWLFKFNNKFILPLIIKMADKVIVTSFDYVENSNIAGLVRENKEKFIEIPCGVLPDHFYPQEKDNNLLVKHNLTANGKIILFVGNLDRAHYFKGVNYLLRAFALIVKNNSAEKIRLLIVGQGDLLSRYKILSEKLGIGDKVIFTGYISNEELPGYYNLADLFVLPSIDKSEAFGLVLLEAMASGKAIVASDLAGVRSVVKEGENGLLAKPGNAEDLAQKISYLLSDESLRKKMGEAGRRHAKEFYSWGKIGKQLETIYKEIL